eukprot:1970196-Rhodomonas_salina.2
MGWVGLVLCESPSGLARPITGRLSITGTQCQVHQVSGSQPEAAEALGFLPGSESVPGYNHDCIMIRQDSV